MKNIVIGLFPFLLGSSYLLKTSRGFSFSAGTGSDLKLSDLLIFGRSCCLVLEPRAQLKVNGKVKFEDRCTVIVHSGGRLILEGENWLMSDCWIEVSEGQTTRIGKRSSFQRRCDLHGCIEIGSDCVFAPDVFISSGGHSFDKERSLTIREQDRLYGAIHFPVSVGNSCWIGIRSWIAPGITIGEKSVVGANSVVTKDTGVCSVNAGVPAKKLRDF